MHHSCTIYIIKLTIDELKTRQSVNKIYYIIVCIFTLKFPKFGNFNSEIRTIFVTSFALSVDKRKRHLFATRNSVIREVPFLRVEKNFARVYVPLRLYRCANCESHLKSEFIARCDWCRNSPWERCPGMNETSWLCKRAGLPRRSKPVNAKVFHFECYSSLSFRRRRSRRRLLLSLKNRRGFTSDAVRALNCRTTNTTWHSEFVDRTCFAAIG